MGICTRRNFLLSICILQLVSTIERQVFDFLGFLWAPILANFFHVIFVIFGFFGAFQYRPRYIIAYVTWCIIWIGWNVFLICFYLSIGALNKDSDVLNLGTGTVSWFEVNGYGCRPMFPTNLTVPIEKDPFRPIRPEKVNSCLMDYEYVEVLHSSIQCALAIMGGIAGIFLSQIFLEEDDSSQANKLSSKLNGIRNSLYSIEFSHNEDSLEDDLQIAPPLSPRPMTPRRVKRRSETARNSLRHTSNRNSLRSSQRRRHVQNPVTRLIEQQQLGLALQNSRTNNLDTSSDYDPNSSHFNLVNQSFAIPNRNYRLQTPNFNKALDASLNSRMIEINTRQNGGSHKPRPASAQFHDQTLSGEPNAEDSAGHTNPTYQQSSMQSLNDEDMYNNRPGSARSSYSNYHGTRTIAYANPTNVKLTQLTQSERPVLQINEFARSISQVHESSRAISYIDNGGIKQMYFQGQATAQVPTNHRRSARKHASTFMQSGPPAYHVQGAVVSETVI